MTVRKRTTLGVVHVTARPPGWDKGAVGIRAIHMAQGWLDIGYNEITNPDGRAEMGLGTGHPDRRLPPKHLVRNGGRSIG